ncbi:MAG: FAD-dependent oxidoreductase [Actinomycetota bacterium]|nr:FAD-dependent oxidoreductase [Actinomycetota bacterium]
MTSNFVIVGGGLAGAKAAEALRANGFEGSITIVTKESHLPYERPPLSKGFLMGKDARESVFVHPLEWYAEHSVELKRDSEAVAVDKASRIVTMSDGTTLPYDKLLLATGSFPRKLSIPGAELSGVFYLREIEDSEAIKSAFALSKSVVVIGAGWIGLETAAAARAAGLDVTILESASLPLVGIVGEQVGQVFADVQRKNGVDLRLNVIVDEIVGIDGRVTGVRLGDGSLIAADMVIVGVGITPAVALAESAGLEVDNGIVVDEHLRTSDPDIYAAGDVANAFNPRIGSHIRVEHWANALNMPAVAVKGMMGQVAVYDRLPYFYSDQYDLGLEYVGYTAPGDFDEVVIRGDLNAGAFIAFWLREGKVQAGMNANIWDVVDPIRELIHRGTPVDSVALGDENVELGSL